MVPLPEGWMIRHLRRCRCVRCDKLHFYREIQPEMNATPGNAEPKALQAKRLTQLSRRNSIFTTTTRRPQRNIKGIEKDGAFPLFPFFHPPATNTDPDHLVRFPSGVR
jgi:hypothetical protein